MCNPNKTDLENNYQELLSAFKDVLSWKWDSRFETFLAEFSVDTKDCIRSTLDQYLSITWDKSNIGKAPDTVKKLVIDLGGLRSGQFLFTSDPNEEAFIFCAWWPWGDNKTISIRIASHHKTISDSEKIGTIQRLKEWLGI